MFEFDIQRFAENIYGTSGNDSITLEQQMYYFNDDTEYYWLDNGDAIIYGYDGNDKITIKYVEAQTIFGGDGDDTVKIIDSSFDNIIYGGNGNDYIRNAAGTLNGMSGGNIIYGGEGNDRIDMSKGIGGDAIDGGAGNDSITINNDILGYSEFTGAVKGGADDDIIYIEHAQNKNGTLYQYASGDGNDTIFGVNFLDTIQITSGTYSTLRNENDLIISVGSGAIILKNIPDDNQINIKDSEGNLNWSVMNGTDGNDSLDNRVPNVSIYSYGGNDNIYNTGKNVFIESGDGSDSITNAGDDVSHNGDNVTIDSSSGNDSIVNYRQSVSINSGAGNDSIVNQGNNYWGAIKCVGDSVTINSGAGDDSIYVYGSIYTSRYRYVSINSGANDDFISLESYKNYSIIEYKNGDGNDSITGLNSDDTLKISGAEYTTTNSGSDLIICVENDSITIVGGVNAGFTIDGTLKSSGSENETLPTGISVKNSIVTASKTFTGNEINLSDYEATKVNAAAVTQAVSILGTAAANSLKGGKGADTIFGGAGNDTVSLGGGKDIYIYSSGNDFIQDYKAGEDKIKLASGSITSASLSSYNVILKTSNGGKISVKNGKGKNITVIDSSGNETSNIYPVETSTAGISIKNSVLTASSSFTGKTIDLADYEKVTKVDATALSKAVSIVGNSANNSLSGGKGKDTIYGGAGNDTLTGGNGKDTFVYSGGKDVITDYTAAQDKIKIDGTISKTSYSGDDVIFKIGSGTLIVKDGKGKNISVTDSSGSQTYSRTLDILYDNNFITDDSNLDSITEQKFAVTEIQNYNEDFAQDEKTLIAYAKK